MAVASSPLAGNSQVDYEIIVKEEEAELVAFSGAFLQVGASEWGIPR
jgi:hypothetical protein